MSHMYQLVRTLVRCLSFYSLVYITQLTVSKCS